MPKFIINPKITDEYTMETLKPRWNYQGTPTIKITRKDLINNRIDNVLLSLNTARKIT